MRPAARGVLAAARLGWAVESNWARPLLYPVLLVLRPLGGALILVVIARVAGAQGKGALEFLVVGAAMWAFVLNGLQRTSAAVVHDREWFKSLKYVVLTPLPLRAYLIGRSGSWLVTSALSAGVVLAVPTLVLDLRIAPHTTHWWLLAQATVLGLTALTATGLGLAGITLAVARHPVGVGEGVTGLLYLVSGAVFPPFVLPGWLEPVSRVLPFTYWLEASRRAILPAYDPAAAGIGDPMGPLFVTTVGAVVVGGWVFWWFERRARRVGSYDRTTEY